MSSLNNIVYSIVCKQVQTKYGVYTYVLFGRLEVFARQNFSLITLAKSLSLFNFQLGVQARLSTAPAAAAANSSPTAAISSATSAHTTRTDPSPASPAAAPLRSVITCGAISGADTTARPNQVEH
jgi:hypothetical protein